MQRLDFDAHLSLGRNGTLRLVVLEAELGEGVLVVVEIVPVFALEKLHRVVNDVLVEGLTAELDGAARRRRCRRSRSRSS